jgi:hypothetical protein
MLQAPVLCSVTMSVTLEIYEAAILLLPALRYSAMHKEPFFSDKSNSQHVFYKSAQYSKIL